MKKIIEWIKSSNHPYHIALCAVGAMLLMAIGAFLYPSLGVNALEAMAGMAVAGMTIEAYQVYLTRSFDLRNTLGDLLADALGIAVGVGLYSLLALKAQEAAIMLLVCSFVSCILAFALPKHKFTALVAFFGCMIIGFSLFVYGTHA